MSTMQLTAGEVWEIGQQRYVLDQLMGQGFLHFRSERSGAPLQVGDGSGGLVLPSETWLRDQFAAGCARRIERPRGMSGSRRSGLLGEYDYDASIACDPKAIFRQDVLRSLDRIGHFSLSAEGIRRALAAIWRAKPDRFRDKIPPSPSTVRRWLKQRGEAGERPIQAMVSMAGKGKRKPRLPVSVRRRMHREATGYWVDQKKSLGDAYDDLCVYLRGLNNWIGRRSSRWRPVPLPAKETFRQCVRSLECYDTVAAKFGLKHANQRFKACGEGLTAPRPLMLGAMDHTIIDCHVVIDFRGWKLLGRPTLTLLVDVHTRCIVGWLLSFEPPSLCSVTECIKRANRPKLRMADRFPDRPELVSIHGKFDKIVVDNGREFVSPSFEEAMIDMGVSVRWAPVGSPTFKAVVERLFGTLNTKLHRKLPGGGPCRWRSCGSGAWTRARMQF